jgi:hypothetical protein
MTTSPQRSFKTALTILTAGAALFFSCATPTSTSTPSASRASATSQGVSLEVACNRARVSAYDAWQAVETDLQQQVDAVHKEIVETDDRHLPPAWMVTKDMFARRDAARAAAPKLNEQLAAVHNARESALLGAVYARDAAKAAEAVIQAASAQQRSAVAWEACKDVAPASPPRPTQTAQGQRALSATP